MFVSKKWTVGLALLAGLTLFTACNKANRVTFQASLESVDCSGAVVNLTSQGIADYAYLVVETENATTLPDAATVYRDGVTGQISGANTTLTITGLWGQTDYTAYIAATTAAGVYYESVVSITFTTADYTEPLTVAQTYLDGFSVYVNVPSSVSEAGNVVRYGAWCLPFFNQYAMYGPIANQLSADGGFGFYLDKPGVVTWTDEDNVVENEYGEEDYKHNPITPGEPTVFVGGEFSWGENYGWEGYYVPLFDADAYYAAADEIYFNGGDVSELNEADYWTGFFNKIEFVTSAPTEMEATVKVETEMAAVKGLLRLTPDEGVFQYGVLICDEYTYQMILELLDGHEEYMQWFVTSYYAYFTFGAMYLAGNAEIDLSETLYLTPETDYHVFITAIDGEDMVGQSFVHEIISTTAKTLPVPEVTVTALESDDPYEVLFNVKNTGDVEITQAKYAANYIRDFEAMLNSGYTYNDLLTYYGNALDAEDIALINSEEGLTISLSSLDDMTTRLAVQVGNEEDTFNDLDAEGSTGIAEATTIAVPAEEPVDSPLFASLPGDWTYTAQARYSTYDYETFTNVYHDTTIVKKVSIYSAVEYPETLPADVVALYEELGLDAENLYDEFKMEAEAYNAKLKGQNRLLVLGFGGETLQYEDSPSAYTPYTPYDLFCSETYNGYDVAALFFDFGPKWYLDVQADGSVVVPFSYEKMPPVANNNGYYTYYMVGLNYDAGSTIFEGEFDVTVAADNATLTVEPLVEAEIPHYPNVAYINYGYPYLAGYEITSGITLTKGYAAPASVSSVKAGAVKTTDYKLAPIDLNESKTVRASKTSFIGEIPQYKAVEYTPVSVETAKARIEAQRPESLRK